MGRKCIFFLKLLTGAYLIFVGVTLLQMFLDERPSNLQAMCAAASLFILVGAGYMIVLFVRLLKRKTKASGYSNMEETQTSVLQRPVRDGSIFRTAPMTAVAEQKQDRLSSRNMDREQKMQKDPSGRMADRPPDHTADRKTAAIQMQTVGPDTMVWKK